MFREMLNEELTAEQEAQDDRRSSGSSSGSGNTTVTRASAHGDLAGTPFQVRQIPAD